MKNKISLVLNSIHYKSKWLIYFFSKRRCFKAKVFLICNWIWTTVKQWYNVMLVIMDYCDKLIYLIILHETYQFLSVYIQGEQSNWSYQNNKTLEYINLNLSKQTHSIYATSTLMQASTWNLVSPLQQNSLKNYCRSEIIIKIIWASELLIMLWLFFWNEWMNNFGFEIL